MDYTWFGRERAPAGEPEAILTYIGVSCEMPKGERPAPRARPVIHHWLGFRPSDDRLQFLDIAVIVVINDGRNDRVHGSNISAHGLWRAGKPTGANYGDHR